MPVKLLDAGSHRRQYTYVDDVIPHIAQAPFVAAAGDVVNLGAEEIVTTSEVVDAVSLAAGREIDVEMTATHRGVHHAQARPLLMQFPAKMAHLCTSLCTTRRRGPRSPNPVPKWSPRADRCARAQLRFPSARAL